MSSIFHKHIFLLSSGFLWYSLHFHKFHTEVKVKIAPKALSTLQHYKAYLWNSLARAEASIAD